MATASRLLLESGAPDGYLLEDGTGVLLLEPLSVSDEHSGGATPAGSVSRAVPKSPAGTLTPSAVIRREATLVRHGGFVAGSDPYYDQVIAATPTNYWRLGEASGDLVDEIGDADLETTNLTYAASGALTGDSDDAAGFDGSASASTADTFAQSPPFSREVWFRSTTALDAGFVYSQNNNPKLGHDEFGQVKWGVGFGESVISPAGYNDGEWHHVVGTVDFTDTWRLYIDGGQVAEGGGFTFAGGPGSLTIGQDDFGGLEGALDELAIYDYDLSSEVIAAHYDVGINGPGDVGLYGDLETTFEAGGESIDLDGALTLAGALTKTAAQHLAGALTTAGTLFRAAAKSLLGAMTPAGSIAKTASTHVGGAEAPSGTSGLNPVTHHAGTLTSAAALFRAASTHLAGALTLAGTLVKSVAPGAYGGTLTTAGALFRASVKVLDGSVTVAGALFRSVSAHLDGTLTVAGSLVRSIATSFGGSETPAGSVARAPAISEGGAETPSGTSGLTPAKVLAGALTLAGAQVITAAKVLGGTLTSAGDTLRVVVLHHLGGTLTLAGALFRSLAVTFVGATEPAGANILTATKVLAADLTASGDLTPTGTLAFGGSVAPAGALAFSVSRTFVGSVEPVSTNVRFPLKHITAG